MPKIKTLKTKYPEGWDLIEPTLTELGAKMREGACRRWRGGNAEDARRGVCRPPSLSSPLLSLPFLPPSSSSYPLSRNRGLKCARVKGL